MKIVVAPDKFKGSLTAKEVCTAMTQAIQLSIPGAEVVAMPMADGGEGTAELLTESTTGTWHEVTVQDPLGRSIKAGYGLSGDKQTAFVEMAQTSGLRLLKPDEYDPFKTHTYGLGELIRHAIGAGVKHIILGIGGSATNDAGMGMAMALGWKFLDKEGQEIKASGGSLPLIHAIQPPANELNVKVEVACDVDNPLCGPQGATYVYSPQKGARPADLPLLDAGMEHWAAIVKKQFQVDLAEVPGAGAAGGVGAGALFFLKARLKAGIELVMENTKLAEKMVGADLILTGEGRIDQQTLRGKLIAGITRLAQEKKIPVVALCGTLAITSEEMDELGLKSAFSIVPGPQSLDSAVQNAAIYLKQTTLQVLRLIKTN
ncbi:glycerate kinase [Tellurirhabdus bombi]|uniref:glycerate kinase n=1 Tax=Tellurirhabdus bombi TaxID=2907205 RepID=UPI001F478CE9|nr:glycerate kinase [Tellurirhabdus bombi]